MSESGERIGGNAASGCSCDASAHPAYCGSGRCWFGSLAPAAKALSAQYRTGWPGTPAKHEGGHSMTPSFFADDRWRKSNLKNTDDGDEPPT